MYLIISLITVLISAIISFVPMSYYRHTNNDTIETKQIMNLSARTLADSVFSSRENYIEISKGYTKLNQFIELDKDKLLQNFNELLRRNISSEASYIKLKQGMLAKVVVYYDRFFIAGENDKWSPPFFFCYKTSDKLLYLMSKYNKAYYYNSDGSVTYTTLEAEGLNEKIRNNLIINSLERVISQYTSEIGVRTGLEVKIYNPLEEDGAYKDRYSHFNVLDGITFFVIYASDRNIDVGGHNIKYHNYNVTGYTLQ